MMAFATSNEIDTTLSAETNLLGVETAAVGVETNMLGIATAKIRNPFEKMSSCGAKRRNGLPCKRIGNKRNGRCRLHGGNAGAPSGERNGRFQHGGQTKEAQEGLRATRRLLRDAANLIRGRS